MSKANVTQCNNMQPTASSIDLNDCASDSSKLRAVHWLIVEDNDGCRRYPLGGEVYSIGRDRNADIVLSSLFVSRQHATLVRKTHDDESYYYQIIDGDLAGNRSANGIEVNDCRVKVHELKHKDEVVFGPQVKITYLLGPDDPTSEPLELDDITLTSPSNLPD